MQVRSPSQEDPLEKKTATHPNILDWRILWTEEAGGLQFRGLQRAGQDRSLLACMYGEPIYRAGIETQIEKGLVDMGGGWCGGEGGRN